MKYTPETWFHDETGFRVSTYVKSAVLLPTMYASNSELFNRRERRERRERQERDE
ncbi:MAG: hypothetical protein HC789_17265 [Microcoleus sp. CSU_2_2]|nr:hypothetical protein [Microcoleus sp. CSU_2_2]